MYSLTIVLPAYNEEARLPRTFDLLHAGQQSGVFQAVDLKAIFVVDDGSKDQTAKTVESEIQKGRLPIQLLSVSPNQGKGNAIHTGIRNAESDFILIADADSATPWNQFQVLWSAMGSNPLNTLTMGSRDLPESQVQRKQSWVREHMGKTFNLIVRFITGLPFKDTQCGFKLFPRKKTETFLNELKVKRFAWDVEFLMFAKNAGLDLFEVPVEWHHQDASRVNAITDSLEMLFQVIRLRLRLLFR